MVAVWTDKFSVSDTVQVAASIIKEYQTTGRATIDLQKEGPCADHVGLYKLLDTVCDQFGFDPANIKIITSNDEEKHPTYNIVFQPRWHLQIFRQYLLENRIVPEKFKNKSLDQNLFGCFYNIPSWDRLCMLSHVKFNTKHPSIVGCNGVLEPHCYNTFELSRVVEYCASELNNIIKLINSGIGPLDTHPSPGTAPKPDAKSQLGVLDYYNNFFVDLVGETYIHGLTFYPTEKTWRSVFAFTPFVISGPQGFLNNLQSRYGLKTFAKWWDESYDNYQNYQRIEKIYQVIDYIDSLSIGDRVTMYNEMMPTLEHNYNILRRAP